MNNAESLLRYYHSLLDCMDIDREQLYVHVSNHIYLNQTLLFEKNLTISEFDRLFYSRWENVDLYSLELIKTTSKDGLHASTCITTPIQEGLNNVCEQR